MIKDKEYRELEKQLEDKEEEILPDSISNCNCEMCGNRMTTEEVEAFETTCEECTWNDTSGLIDDEEEREL